MACSTATTPCIHYVDCPNGVAACHTEAMETCPSGYQMMDESTLGAGFGDFSKAHFEGAAAGTPHILVTCNP
jgi:hypothetical protein